MTTDSKLCKLPTGEWAIAAPGRQPVRIVAGDIFEIEVSGTMRRAKMMDGMRVVAGYAHQMPITLHEGMHARFNDGREKFANPAKG